MENKNSGKNRKTKMLAIALITVLCIHLYGLLYTVSVHNAFAATDTFSVENTVYINVTEMSKGPGNWKLVKLTISESVDLRSSASNSETTFSPNESETRSAIMDINERQELPVGQMTFAGQTFKITSDTMFGVASTFANGTSIAVNTSDYYKNFTRIQQAYPVREKMLLFDSPANYAERFCDAHGYTFNNVVNSTYTEYLDINSMNLFNSHLVKTDYIITAPINTSALSTQFWPIVALVAVVCITFFFSLPALTDMCRIRQAGLTARAQIDADKNVTIEGIDAQREIDVALTGARAADEQMILAMIANGSLTYDEGAALIAAIGADYSDLLSNRTTNIEDILDNYYNHTNDMWDHYKQGLGIGTSWTDYLWTIIIVIIIGFSIYLIYVLLVRKGPKGQPQNVFIIPK